MLTESKWSNIELFEVFTRYFNMNLISILTNNQSCHPFSPNNISKICSCMKIRITWILFGNLSNFGLMCWPIDQNDWNYILYQKSNFVSDSKKLNNIHTFWVLSVHPSNSGRLHICLCSPINCCLGTRSDKLPLWRFFGSRSNRHLTSPVIATPYTVVMLTCIINTFINIYNSVNTPEHQWLSWVRRHMWIKNNYLISHYPIASHQWI